MTKDTATPCVAERSFHIPVCGLLKWDDAARFWRAIRGLIARQKSATINYAVPDNTNALTVSDSQGGELAPLERLAGQARAFIEAAKAENSRRAYRSDWRLFAAWCQRQGLPALPATPETVTLYMTALAADHKPASLQRKLTSITKAHQAAGFPSPAAMQHAVVSETMKGIRRTIVTAQPGKLRTVDIREMLDSLDDDLRGCRDRALLLAGFAGGFQRSELAALDVGDVSKTEDGFVIRVRRSKTDPEGKGTSVALPYGSAGATCPVRSYLPRLDRQGSPHRGAGLPRRRPARAIHLTTSETRNMPEVVSQTFAPPSADDPL